MIHLEDQEYGDPLVVRVVDGRVGARAARAVALKVLGDVEGAVHPAVVLQGVTADPPARQVALDWVSKELVETSHGREDKKQHACVLKLELIQESEGVVLPTL